MKNKKTIKKLQCIVQISNSTREYELLIANLYDSLINLKNLELKKLIRQKLF